MPAMPLNPYAFPWRVTLFRGRKADAARHVFVPTRFAQFRGVRSRGRSPPPRNKFISYPCEARTSLYWHGLRAAITCSHSKEFSRQESSARTSNDACLSKGRELHSNLSCNSKGL